MLFSPSKREWSKVEEQMFFILLQCDKATTVLVCKWKHARIFVFARNNESSVLCNGCNQGKMRVEYRFISATMSSFWLLLLMPCCMTPLPRYTFCLSVCKVCRQWEATPNRTKQSFHICCVHIVRTDVHNSKFPLSTIYFTAKIG